MPVAQELHIVASQPRPRWRTLLTTLRLPQYLLLQVIPLTACLPAFTPVACTAVALGRRPREIHLGFVTKRYQACRWYASQYAGCTASASLFPMFTIYRVETVSLTMLLMPQDIQRSYASKVTNRHGPKAHMPSKQIGSPGPQNVRGSQLLKSIPPGGAAVAVH